MKGRLKTKKIFVLLMVLILFLSACGKANLNSDTSAENTAGKNNTSEINSSYTSSQNSSFSYSSVPSLIEEDNETSSEDKKSPSLEEALKEILEKGEELSREDEEHKELLEENIKILAKSSKKNKSFLITESYPEEQIFEKYPIGRFFQPTHGYIPSMGMCDDFFGLKIECVRQLEEDSYYCIFKTKENGYLYSFFRESGDDLPIYNSCYIKESLTKADFKNLKVGDSIENVTKIDSAFSAEHNYNANKGWGTSSSIHLLKDGLLSITYENNAIKSIEFNKDFEYTDYVIIDGIRHDLLTYSYKIFEEDYPGEDGDVTTLVEPTSSLPYIYFISAAILVFIIGFISLKLLKRKEKTIEQ